MVQSTRAAAKLGWRRQPACLDGGSRFGLSLSAQHTRPGEKFTSGAGKLPVRRWKGEFDGESREAERHASGYRLTCPHCRTPSCTPLMNELLQMSKNESASASRTKIMQIITMRKPSFAARSPTRFARIDIRQERSTFYPPRAATWPMRMPTKIKRDPAIAPTESQR